MTKLLRCEDYCTIKYFKARYTAGKKETDGSKLIGKADINSFKN